MWSLGPVGFLSPWLLAGLVLLPMGGGESSVTIVILYSLSSAIRPPPPCLSCSRTFRPRVIGPRFFAVYRQMVKEGLTRS